jgi:YHS domain-containing protein
MKPKYQISGLLLAALLFVSAGVGAAPIDKNADANDVALHGYDPVAYFKPGTPTRGKADITSVYEGVIYRFTSVANRDAFRQDPGRYVPQFGGFCAMGTAMGLKLDVDPQAWRVVDGKLYLNLNKDVQKKWLSDVPGNLSQANAKWPEIKDKDPKSLKN